MTAIIIKTPTQWVAISDFYRPIAFSNTYFEMFNYVRGLGYDVLPSRSRQAEAILERSGFQKMKGTLR